jgi:hypothetical protein
MILFSLPDYYGFFNLNLALLDIMESQREKFYDDIVVDSIYGSFPCIWNGGRFYEGGTSFGNIIATTTPFTERGISLRHTFTNCLLTEEHLKDTLCNKICELTHNSLHGANVNSILLKEYLEEKYPDFYIMWSTTLCTKDLAQINSLSEKNLLVLDYNLNNNFEFLAKLEHPENIEILVCETCIPNCPNRKEHYLHESNCQLFNETSHYDCPWVNNSTFYAGAYQQPHYVSIDNIRQNYLPLGINKFKIMGRGRPAIETIENYVNYLVKPEYKDDLRIQLLATLG